MLAKGLFYSLIFSKHLALWPLLLSFSLFFGISENSPYSHVQVTEAAKEQGAGRREALPAVQSRGHSMRRDAGLVGQVLLCCKCSCRWVARGVSPGRGGLVGHDFNWSLMNGMFCHDMLPPAKRFSPRRAVHTARSCSPARPRGPCSLPVCQNQSPRLRSAFVSLPLCPNCPIWSHGHICSIGTGDAGAPFVLLWPSSRRNKDTASGGDESPPDPKQATRMLGSYHPQLLGQCTSYLTKRLPKASQQLRGSTSSMSSLHTLSITAVQQQLKSACSRVSF